MNNQFLESVIRTCMHQMYIYSKVQFDNAKDAQALITASNESADMLIQAVSLRLQERVDQMLVDKIENQIDHSKKREFIVRIGDRYYTVKEATP